jgi:hypothetical protein
VLDARIHATPTRGVIYRNSPFGVSAWRSVGQPARYTGRFHRRGEPLPLYAADSQLAALRELELHSDLPLVPAREILRRVSAIGIAGGTRILLGDHAETLDATALTLEQLYHPTDYSACHALTEFARSVPGVVAISTQSNADRGQRTIAVLPEHVPQVTALVDYWEGSLNLLNRAFVSSEALPQPSG